MRPAARPTITRLTAVMQGRNTAEEMAVGIYTLYIIVYIILEIFVIRIKL